MRVFTLSNWTELDIWEYIGHEKIEVVSLYFAKMRPIVKISNTWIMVDDDRMPLNPGEIPELRMIRFRTLGCYPLSGAIESEAGNVSGIIAELKSSRFSESQGRLINTEQSFSMERKKKKGYF